jgi:hypothetical protein
MQSLQSFSTSILITSLASCEKAEKYIRVVNTISSFFINLSSIVIICVVSNVATYILKYNPFVALIYLVSAIFP